MDSAESRELARRGRRLSPVEATAQAPRLAERGLRAPGPVVKPAYALRQREWKQEQEQEQGPEP